MSDEHLYRMALTHVPGVGLVTARRLLESVESATWLFRHRHELLQVVPDVSPKLVKALDCPEALRLCEAEMAFAEKNGIACLIDTDAGYPSRLRDCADAPLVLFYRGTADLNRRHVINVVGTRHATDYGKELCETFVHELKQLVPDVLVVSGLAYGVDIIAHRAALQNGLDTVGVLAHGLDRIYPYVHRDTAAQMVRQGGGLLTEFPSGTTPDRQNFVKRNRIVACMADATVVVQSARKGGALITAGIAESYGRECFAFPGRVGDTFSEGCNDLIRQRKAVLLQHAEELVKEMNWDKPSAASGVPAPVQRQLFPELSEEELPIVHRLQQHPDGLQVNTLVVECNIPIHKMTGLLFGLEMKGVVRAQAGGMYKLLV